MYFNINEEGIYGEITDKTNSSVDSYSILLSEEGQNVDMSFPVHFDIVRLLTSSSSDKINVQINTNQGYCIFNIDTGTSNLKYIVSGLQS